MPSYQTVNCFGETCRSIARISVVLYRSDRDFIWTTKIYIARRRFFCYSIYSNTGNMYGGYGTYWF